MSKGGSVVYQVKRAFQKIFTPGVSQKRLEVQGKAYKRITSIRTMQDYISAGCRLAHFAEREYGIDLINEITLEMADAYIQKLQDDGRSDGHIGRETSAIRKLDIAMREKGWRNEDAPGLLE